MTAKKASIKEVKPPSLGVKLVHLAYDTYLVDEVLGDLQEVFIDRAENKGLVFAKAHYFLDAIMSFRNYDLRRKEKTRNNSIDMIRNYIKSTFRTLAKNRVYSFLNILGLAFGIAACLFIVQYVQYEYSYDKFHSKHEDIYRVRYQIFRGEDIQVDCAAAVPRVGPFMKESMPEVLEFARAFPMTAVFESNNQQYREKRVQIADPSFLDIFDYPLIHGEKRCLDCL